MRTTYFKLVNTDPNPVSPNCEISCGVPSPNVHKIVRVCIDKVYPSRKIRATLIILITTQNVSFLESYKIIFLVKQLLVSYTHYCLGFGVHSSMGVIRQGNRTYMQPSTHTALRIATVLSAGERVLRSKFSL